MEKNNEEILLSENDVWSVIEFARAMSGGLYGSSYLNPELISGRMKDITLNPLAATEEMLATAMANPKNYESQLQGFSQSFELSSMVYKRLLTYLANMLSFDITYTSNAKPEDYNTPKYKKDLDVVENFLDRFDYKREFRIAIKEMLRNDAFFGCFVDTGDKMVIQELPSEYCKITGKWGNGFLFSFNMYWFMMPGVDIEMYPPFFKKKYKEIWQNPSAVQNYIPSLPPEFRDKSSWIYWVDVPSTLGVCFKLTPELATRLPYFTPLFNDLVLQGLMRNLQKNINMAAASKIILGQVPLLNKEIKATVKDSIAISPDLLGKFMALVKNAISDSIKVASAPLEDMKGISFDSDNEVYEQYLRTALASSGVNSNLIFSSNIKPNAIETQLSLNVDEQLMTALYSQFDSFMDYFINKYTRTFKFNFEFEGTEFFLNRDKRLENAMTLFDKGIILPQKIAAAIGIKPAHLRRQMEEAKAFKFVENLTPPAVEQAKKTAEFNAQLLPNDPSGEKTGEGSKKGRPRKPESELSDEGVQTRTEGTNIGRGGKA